MFNSENATKNIAAKVTLMDGSVQMGNLIIGITSDLLRTLNGDVKFLEFEDMSGSRCFFARHSIARVTPTDIPKVKKLEAGAVSNEDFNPHKILNISPEADARAVQDAYQQMLKQYHPDRFSGIELPAEMARYVDAMTKLVEAAFQALNSQTDQADPLPIPHEQNLAG